MFLIYKVGENTRHFSNVRFKERYSRLVEQREYRNYSK
nr:MAG TPA: hypothetical protein [Caudoviricetes sp.]